MLGSWSMANLALDICKRLLRLSKAIPVPSSQADNMAYHAPGLVVPVSIQQGLIRGGVLRRGPLDILRLVALFARRCACVSFVRARGAILEEWTNAGLRRFQPTHAVVESVPAV